MSILLSSDAAVIIAIGVALFSLLLSERSLN